MLAAQVTVLNVNLDLRVGIFTTGMESVMGLLMRKTASTKPTGTTAKQAFKKVTEMLGVRAGEFPTVKLKPLVPPRRRPEVLPGLPVGTQFVIGSAFFGVGPGV